MHIVITNDDGVDAPGLHRLAVAVVAAGHEVVVAAPRTGASGSGAALTAVTEDDRVRVERRDPPVGDGPTYLCHAVDASPAYIALLAALGAFGPVRTCCCPASTAGPTPGMPCCTPAPSAPP